MLLAFNKANPLTGFVFFDDDYVLASIARRGR
jgi:hypothetical protein